MIWWKELLQLSFSSKGFLKNIYLLWIRVKNIFHINKFWNIYTNKTWLVKVSLGHSKLKSKDLSGPVFTQKLSSQKRHFPKLSFLTQQVIDCVLLRGEMPNSNRKETGHSLTSCEWRRKTLRTCNIKSDCAKHISSHTFKVEMYAKLQTYADNILQRE